MSSPKDLQLDILNSHSDPYISQHETKFNSGMITHLDNDSKIDTTINKSLYNKIRVTIISFQELYF